MARGRDRGHVCLSIMKAHHQHTHYARHGVQRGSSFINEYFTKMKALAYEMASTGKKLEDEELVSYILTGLDLDFNLVVSAVAFGVEPISISFEHRMELPTRGS